MATDLSLVLGGAASGKSRLAEQLTERTGGGLVYIATASDGDDEMREKIKFHQNRRGPEWLTIEEPAQIAEVLRRLGQTDAVLIDCLTMWVLNMMTAESCVGAAAEDLMRAAANPGSVVMVSGETGMGIVPDNALSRRFSNELGRVNQLVASHADLVVLTVAGQPVILKGQRPEWL